MMLECILSSRTRCGHAFICHLLCAGGDKFEVKAKRVGKGFTAAVVVGKVEDTGEGMYRAIYSPNFAGTYEVHVTSKGTQALRPSRPSRRRGLGLALALAHLTVNPHGAPPSFSSLNFRP